MTNTIPRFHLAVPVTDLGKARAFYGGVLGCPEGRSSDRWIDWNLYGHQFVTHLVDGPGPEVAHTRLTPGSASSPSRASRFAGRSSTSRMLTSGPEGMMAAGSRQ